MPKPELHFAERIEDVVGRHATEQELVSRGEPTCHGNELGAEQLGACPIVRPVFADVDEVHGIGGLFEQWPQDCVERLVHVFAAVGVRERVNARELVQSEASLFKSLLETAQAAAGDGHGDVVCLQPSDTLHRSLSRFVRHGEGVPAVLCQDNFPRGQAVDRSGEQRLEDVFKRHVGLENPVEHRIGESGVVGDQGRSSVNSLDTIHRPAHLLGDERVRLDERVVEVENESQT